MPESHADWAHSICQQTPFFFYPSTRIFINLQWRKRPTNLGKIHKSLTYHLHNWMLYLHEYYPAVRHHMPPPQPVRESSTHEWPFLISHTFEKCQKCFMRLVSAQLVQSDAGAVRTDNSSGGLAELRAREGEAQLFEYPAVMYGRTVWCLCLWEIKWPIRSSFKSRLT